MNPHASARARRLVAVLGLVTSVAASCGDDEPTGEPSGGTGAGGGTTTAGGTAGRGGTTGDGGVLGGGEGGGAGESGGPTGDCSRDDDCVPLNECYSATCRDGTCVGSPLARGSACEDGFCNGFARCLPCLDDAAGMVPDTGCSSRSPMCDELASEPECAGCLDDADCDDDVECTVDRCSDSKCENTAQELGAPCIGGFCTGASDENRCVPCVDDASAGFDRGCTPELPRCDTESTPPTCSACRSSVDCYDDNECTSDECFDGVCGHATILGGTPCTYGYCNGIRGAEVCVPKPCQTDPDCDDRAACTTEVCRAGFCDYTTNDGQCSDSGDVCRPNVCTVGTGCRVIDASRSLELLSNGNLDLASEDWVELGETYPQVIFPYDYIPTLFPHTPVNVAWLGNGEAGFDESNSLSQTLAVPAGAVRLELSFFYQIWTDELPDDHNRLEVRLRSTAASPSDESFLTLHNQDATRVWTGFRATIDATEWAGGDATLEFSGTSIDGYSAFFVDSISLVATVCD